MTHASPPVGSRMPASRRMSVVLPAPSGPTSPKISPGATDTVTRSTASTAPKVRLSSLVRMASTGHPLLPHPAFAGLRAINSPTLRRVDDPVDGHSGLELHVRVLDVHLDA